MKAFKTFNCHKVPNSIILTVLHTVLIYWTVLEDFICFWRDFSQNTNANYFS